VKLALPEFKKQAVIRLPINLILRQKTRFCPNRRKNRIKKGRFCSNFRTKCCNILSQKMFPKIQNLCHFDLPKHSGQEVTGRFLVHRN